MLISDKCSGKVSRDQGLQMFKVLIFSQINSFCQTYLTFISPVFPHLKYLQLGITSIAFHQQFSRHAAGICQPDHQHAIRMMADIEIETRGSHRHFS